MIFTINVQVKFGLYDRSQSTCMWKSTFAIRFVPRTSRSAFSLSRNIRIRCNPFLDISYDERHEFFFVTIIWDHMLGQVVLFVQLFTLYSIISRWGHSSLLLSFMFTTLKNENFSNFQQQFVLMLKAEQLVVRTNYKQYFNSFFCGARVRVLIPVYRYQNPTGYFADFILSFFNTFVSMLT